MKTSLILAVLVLALNGGSQARKIVCYYESWAYYFSNGGVVLPEDLDANLCTHVNYAFVAINEDGSLKSEDEWLDVDQGLFYRVTDLKNKNPNLKVLLSIGGSSAPSQTFAAIARDPGKRAAMVGSARWFVETFHFDGIDLDWEKPYQEDNANYISLLQDFRNDFDRNGWEVSAAVSAIPEEGYNVPRMNELLDHINLMTYDMYGPDWSEYTGQNSALYPSSVESQWERDNLNMAASVRNWINAGASPGKICAGVAFYGRTFALADPSINGLHAPIKGAGNPGSMLNEWGGMSYAEVCTNRDAWSCIWDDEQKNPYCVNGDQWLGYDDEGSVRDKVAFINEQGLGGAMIWSIDQDDVNYLCGGAKQPLLHAIYDNIDK